jgi:hypothetical protein
MAPPNTRARANWAIERATSLPEVWALIAKHSGVLGARQLMRVCRAARAEATEYLRNLPGLVVCGGYSNDGARVSDVLRLNLATLRWEPMPAMVTARFSPACCAVRGALVVLGGSTREDEGDGENDGDEGDESVSKVEILSSSEEGGAFAELPPLSCGEIEYAAAIVVDESDSAAGQVLLLGGWHRSGQLSTLQLADLATGACAPQNNLLHARAYPAAGRLLDGRVVCAGGIDGYQSAEVWGPPEQGGADAAWTWTELSEMSAGRYGCCGCVMSDGRFAVLGGYINGAATSSCEALTIDDGVVHWEPLAPMHDARTCFACGVSPGASSSPAGMVSNQLNCTMKSSTGGCGCRAICLTKVRSIAWAARFCKTIPGTCSQANPSPTRDRARVFQSSLAGVCQPYA